MLDWCLGVMAVASCILNYQSVLYDWDGETMNPAKRFKSLLGWMIATVFSVFGTQKGQNTVLAMVGFMWAGSYIYHFLVAVLLGKSVMISIINVLTGIVTSIIFVRTMYRASAADAGHKSYCDDILTLAGGYWEIVLAGTVIISLTIKQYSL